MRAGVKAWALLGAGLLLSPGCYSLGPFACTDAAQCVGSEGLGICAEPGYCAFEDDACPSGFRFDDLASRGLSGACVEPPSGTGSASSTGLDPLSTTSGSAGSTAASASSSSSSSAEADSTGTINLCGDRPCPCAVELQAGLEHTCAIRTDGSIVCWGNDELAALGRGEFGGVVAWPQRVALPADFVAATLTAGDHNNCATSEDGQLYCWGRNAAGEVDPSLGAAPVATPAEVGWASPASAVDAGLNNTCAVADGLVSCWGDNADGQLGEAMAAAGPSTVGGGSPLQGVEGLAVANRHACARVAEAIWCWGTNFDGQLGTLDAPASSPDPVEVTLVEPARALAAGGLHTCAVVGDRTQVQCWGSGGVGQLGTGDGLDSDVPVDIMLTLGEEVVQLSAKGEHTCLLTTAGDVYCWGPNGGDIFDTGESRADAPVRVEVADTLPEPIERIAVGLRHLCVITEGGHVFCWGSDDVEQLGPFDPPLNMRATELDLACDEIDA
ncbi:MAG: RCC1 domain-containing protein [Nannocystaceae bacterium]|nr:hypothetical protein [bacterium]